MTCARIDLAAWTTGALVFFVLNLQFSSELAFDVGSHAGNRVRAFRRLGARVVAVEPQPDLVVYE